MLLKNRKRKRPRRFQNKYSYQSKFFFSFHISIEISSNDRGMVKLTCIRTYKEICSWKNKKNYSPVSILLNYFCCPDLTLLKGHDCNIFLILSLYLKTSLWSLLHLSAKHYSFSLRSTCNIVFV